MVRTRNASESEPERNAEKAINDLQVQVEGLNALLVKQGALLNELRAERANRVDNADGVDRAVHTSEIPELIKLTPTFDGTPSALAAFIESVDQKIAASEANFSEAALQHLRPIWVGLIRDKIIGKANDVLVDEQTALVWGDIKTTLREKIVDKREIPTLLAEVSRLRQGPRSVDEFYQKCKALLTNLNAHVILNNPESKQVRETYEALVINAFMDGLHDELNDFTRSCRPKSLLAAYEAAYDQQQTITRRKINARKFANQQNAGPSNSSNGKKYTPTKYKSNIATHEVANDSEDDASEDEANFPKHERQQERP